MNAARIEEPSARQLSGPPGGQRRPAGVGQLLHGEGEQVVVLNLGMAHQVVQQAEQALRVGDRDRV